MNYYGKDQCLQMDWNNTKEISAEELAYCIFTYDLDINVVPEKRLSLVKKELQKLQIENKKAQNKKEITNVLAQFEQVLVPPETTGLFKDIEIYENTSEVIGYQLNIELFQTLEEAELAISELDRLLHRESTYTEIHNGVYKDPNTRARDIQRLQQGMEKILNQYKALGGDTGTFYDAIKHIPVPEPSTLNHTIMKELESIQELFIQLGVSKTRATKISKNITTTALSYLR